MPFTLSHPAAVIPLAKLLKHRVAFSALIIGSMMPDMAYFFALDVEREYSHSLLGLFTYCLPLGLVLYALFHLLLKLPLVALLGMPLQTRLYASSINYRQLPQASKAVVVMSILLGAFTHLVWDAFTHGRGPVIETIPELSIVLFTAYGIHFPVFRLLQHLSTALGLMYVMYALWRWFRHTQPVPVPASLRVATRHTRGVWVGMLLIPIMVGLLVGLYGLAEYEPESWAHVIPKAVVLAVLPVWVMYLVAYSIGWHSGWLKLPPNKGNRKV